MRYYKQEQLDYLGKESLQQKGVAADHDYFEDVQSILNESDWTADIDDWSRRLNIAMDKFVKQVLNKRG